METSIQNLQNNFLFQLSLASKEIFHSNLIAWLLEQKDKDEKYCVLQHFLEEFGQLEQGVISDRSHFKILRESNKIDLTIEYKDTDKWKFIFIENKMKSIPTHEQLKSYDKKINSLTFGTEKLKPDDDIRTKMVKKYLLTPDVHDIKFDEWENITYREDIINFLNKIKDLNFYNEDVSFVIQKYIDFLENLVNLIRLFICDQKDFLEQPYNYYGKYLNPIRKIKLHDLILKLIHSKISHILKTELTLKVPSGGTNSIGGKKLFHITSGFTNSTGLSSIQINLIDGFSVGLQLQGNVIRYFTLCRMGLNSHNVKFANNLYSRRIWFKDKDKDGGGMLVGNGRNKELYSQCEVIFCEYDKGAFIYLNKRLTDEPTVSNGSLISFLIEEVMYVIENKEKFIEQIPGEVVRDSTETK